MREMQCSNRVGGQLIDVVGVEHQIDEDGQKLEQHQSQVDTRIDLVQQHWAAGEAEHEMANRLHEPDVWLQISHQTSMFAGLNLHLQCGRKKHKKTQHIKIKMHRAIFVVVIKPWCRWTTEN